MRAKEFGSSPRAWGRSPGPCCRLLARPVHPHVRGADKGRWAKREYHQRFIPTCVGQMHFRAVQPQSGSVHPHVRGADGHFHDRIQPGVAVHPHVRGADGEQGR